MTKKKSNTEEATNQDAKQLSFEEIFQIVVSNFGHVQENQIIELFELLNNKEK